MTKHYTLIGDPVEHSLSPFIYRTLYRLHNVDADYSLTRVAKGQLAADFLPQCARLSGFNITMPHKEDIIPLLDSVDQAALDAHSVNTVVIDAAGRHGYSTDGAGFLRALGTPLPTPALILGAGGAAGALATAWCGRTEAPLTLMARSPQKAQPLLERLAALGRPLPLVVTWTADNLARLLPHTRLLVNSTPLGMVGHEQDFADLSFLESLPADALVFDLIYAPRQTSLLKAAAGRGLATANGLDMLIYQAMEAFTLQSGIAVPDRDKDMIVTALEQAGLI